MSYYPCKTYMSASELQLLNINNGQVLLEDGRLQIDF
jgi:hypothetical protein